MEIIKLIIVFAIILLLFKFRFSIGAAIFCGGLALGLFFGQDPVALMTSVYRGIVAWETIRLTLIVCIIGIQGSFLKHLAMTDKLVSGVKNLSGSTKTTMALLPAIIGLMPMPGGALLSAPLVGSAAQGQKITGVRLAAINYWFRHIMEFIMPIYPGLILSAAILRVKVTKLALMQIPFSLAMIVGGMIFLLLPLRDLGKVSRNQSWKMSTMNILECIWPILLAIFLAFGFGIDILFGLAIALVLFLVFRRPPRTIIFRAVKEGASFSTLSLVFGVMVFQTIINESGAAVDLAALIASWKVPDEFILVAACFLIGFLTGMNAAYIGIVYPILIGLLLRPEPDFSRIILAYVSGFLGVIVSPLHLCLILTKEYFKSSMGRIYLLILGPVIFLIIVLALLLLLGYGT